MDSQNNGKKEFWRAVMFTLISISAGLIQMGSFELMSKLLQLDYWISYPVSVLLSVIWNFTFNRRYTFQSAANVPVAMLKVLAFYAVFTPVTTIGGTYLVEKMLWNEDLVFVITMLLNFVLEYLYQRFFVFKNNLDDLKIEK